MDKLITTQEKISEVLENTFRKYPQIVYEVRELEILSQPMIAIKFHIGTHEINRVSGQYVQQVSLCLTPYELKVQHFGGMGGQSIYRKIDPNHPKERFLAMQRIKIPFRKPQMTEASVLGAIERFALNYLKELKANVDVLMYQELVDYSFLK